VQDANDLDPALNLAAENPVSVRGSAVSIFGGKNPIFGALIND
jgi:hypothetical protein